MHSLPIVTRSLAAALIGVKFSAVPIDRSQAAQNAGDLQALIRLGASASPLATREERTIMDGIVSRLGRFAMPDLDGSLQPVLATVKECVRLPGMWAVEWLVMRLLAEWKSTGGSATAATGVAATRAAASGF